MVRCPPVLRRAGGNDRTMRAFLPGPAQGRIILLNGASSSGKSSLARALQSGIDTPFRHISIDHLRDSGVLPTARIRSGEFDWRSMRDAFFLGFEGFERSLLAYERCEILCRTDRDRAGDGGAAPSPRCSKAAIPPSGLAMSCCPARAGSPMRRRTARNCASSTRRARR